MWGLHFFFYYILNGCGSKWTSRSFRRMKIAKISLEGPSNPTICLSLSFQSQSMKWRANHINYSETNFAMLVLDLHSISRVHQSNTFESSMNYWTELSQSKTSQTLSVFLEPHQTIIFACNRLFYFSLVFIIYLFVHILLLSFDISWRGCRG